LLERAVKDPGELSRHDSGRILEAATLFNDGAQLLFLLTNPRHEGARCLRIALSHDDSPSYVQRSILPFLERLGGDDMCRGTCKSDLRKIVVIMFETPGFVSSLRKLARDRKDLDVSALSWFVLQLATLSAEARTDQTVRDLAAELIERNAPRSTNIATVLSGSNADADAAAEKCAGLQDVRDVPGGRHANDHTDFRSIQIAPTVDEVHGELPPFLPDRDDDWLCNPEASLLDRQFRFLREDMLGPMRASLHELAKQDPHRPASSRSLQVCQGVRFEGVVISPRPCVRVSFRLPEGHYAAKLRGKKALEFWESPSGSKFFPRDSLVALVNGGKVQQLAIVADVDVKDLSRCDQKGRPSPTIGLAFAGRGFPQVDASKLAELLKLVGSHEPTNLALVRACAGFFTYAPVLESLQKMDEIPFCEEIARGVDPAPATYLEHLDLEAELADMARRDGFEYDASQLEAMRLALTRRVSLTQGASVFSSCSVLCSYAGLSSILQGRREQGKPFLALRYPISSTAKPRQGFLSLRLRTTRLTTSSRI
jgi:hypothetical protein